MFELNWTNGVTAAAAVAAVLALVGLVTSMRSAAASRRAPPLDDVTADEWTPTGQVNLSPVVESMISDDTETRKKLPVAFILEAEDVRTRPSATGVSKRETRWRYATQAEAEQVMSVFHKDLTNQRRA